MANLFVGNLPFSTTEEELSDAFRARGFRVQRSRVIRDRDSGQSRGFGFVELSPAEDEERAIAEFHGTRICGRTIRVFHANPVRPASAAA